MPSEMQLGRLEATIISFNAAISTCEKGKQWHWALGMPSEMQQGSCVANIVVLHAAISDCDKVQQ